jgi:hypothetical protein
MPSDFDETEFGSRRIVSSPPPTASEGDSGEMGAEPGSSSRSLAADLLGKAGRGSRRFAGRAGTLARSGVRRLVDRTSSEVPATDIAAGDADRVSQTTPAAGDDEPESTEETGGVLVPVDQWSRILNQLGNLHEAGQQLADARERAAKAETEAIFLRERLGELRSELARLRSGEQ